MSFDPEVGLVLEIDGARYTVQPHPTLLALPYGQEGRRATVYQLAGPDQTLMALKVFKASYRTLKTAQVSERMRPYAALPGLEVCQRSVVMPARNQALVARYPDLCYAVVMPWVAGNPWQEMVHQRRVSSPELSLALARSLAESLAVMELQGLAHCDLSGGNVLVVRTRGSAALVDLEDMYAPRFEQPEKVPGGSPGYAHRTAPAGMWGALADRFSAVVLLAEMLAWYDPEVRSSAWGECYFNPEEIQTPCPRLEVLRKALRARWGDPVVKAFDQAWGSEQLDTCPTLRAWAELLGVRLPNVTPHPAPALTTTRAPATLPPANLPGVAPTLAGPPPAPPGPATPPWFGDGLVEPLVEPLPTSQAGNSARIASPRRAGAARLVAAIFGVAAVMLLILAILAQGQIGDFWWQLVERVGVVGQEAFAVMMLATLLALVCTWIFRRSARRERLVAGILGVAGAGLVAGGIVGAIIEGSDLEASYLPLGPTLLLMGLQGAVVGVGAGIVFATIWQPGQRGRIAFWSALGALAWGAIWAAGFGVAFSLEGVLRPALAWAVIVGLTGALLAYISVRVRSLELSVR